MYFYVSEMLTYTLVLTFFLYSFIFDCYDSTKSKKYGKSYNTCTFLHY